MNTAPTTNHYSMIHQLYPQPTEPCVLSLNYDLIIDTAMMFVSEGRGDMQGRFPDYGCDIQNDFYKEDPKRFGKLLKLHGSLNWLYCKACHRLEIGASEARKYLKILQKIVSLDLENSYTMQGQACQNCKGEMRPLLVAPTHLKDYRNPHLTQIWYRAEQVLRKADRVVFIGYSLPDDDLEVVYLLKRSLGHLTPQQITVVEYAPPTPATATTPAIPSPNSMSTPLDGGIGPCSAMSTGILKGWIPGLTRNSKVWQQAQVNPIKKATAPVHDAVITRERLGRGLRRRKVNSGSRPPRSTRPSCYYRFPAVGKSEIIGV